MPLAIPPTVTLSPAETDRLAALAEPAKSRALEWLTSGDRVLVSEARRLIAPVAPPKPAPATLEELLGRLREDPSHVPTAAAALCQAFDDHKSYSGYLARLTEAWEGKRAPAELLEAYRQASSGRAKRPGALFMHVLR